MDEKTKELIALGASVTAHCQPCVKYHLALAQKLGISEELIQEAIGIGQMVERGAGSAMRDFITEMLGKPAPNTGCCPATKCS
jgi:AhpD family alkylhydroperoxidase